MEEQERAPAESNGADDLDDMDALVDVSDMNPQTQQTVNTAGVREPQAKKKRGRPPKNPIIPNKPAAKNPIMPNKPAAPLIEKRRGQPRKTV